MIYYTKTVIYIVVIGSLLFISCSDSSTNYTTSEKDTPSTAESSTMNEAQTGDPRNIDLNGMENMDDINAMLAENGLNIRLAYAETVTKADGAEAAGQTIFANDRTKRLDAQWVPGDERRDADGNNLTYTVWEPFAPANYGTSDQFDGTPAIDDSFVTWNNVKKKSKLDILKEPNTNVNPSAIIPGGDPFQADISTTGFLSPLDFELFVGPGTSSNVLGVTFTFVFIDEDSNPTDINNDGYDDVALKEVWYNDGFLWTDEGNTGDAIDVETVALHENGHALGFGHFGKISVTDANDKLHVSPRAVMNAIILGTQRTLLGTDKASYNSIYGNWPKK